MSFREIRELVEKEGMTKEAFDRAFELLFLKGGVYKALWADWKEDGDGQHQVFWLGDGANQIRLQLRHDEQNRKKKLKAFRVKHARVLAFIGRFKKI